MKKILHFSLICLFSINCIAQRVITVKVKEIKSIGIMPIKSSIEVIKSTNDPDGNNPTQQIWINQNVNSSFLLGLDSLMLYIKLPSQQMLVDSMTMLIYDKEMENLLHFFPKDKAISKGDLKDFLANKVISEVLANSLKNQNQRYGLFVLNLGYTRTKLNHAQFHEKMRANNAITTSSGILFGAVGGLIAGAATYTNQNYSNLTTFAFIADSDTRKIINCFVGNSLLDPQDKILNQKITQNHVFPCFSDFWVWFHSEAQQYVISDRK